MKKFIFLDIDGVLNSEKFFVARANSKESPKGMLDPEAVKLLNKITDATGAEIVISSSWGYCKDTLDSLKGVGLTGKIIAGTHKLHYKYDWVCRGNEIEHWLFHAEDGAKLNKWTDDFRYVIFDDDTDMLYQQKNHFINTNFMTGLTESNVTDAIRILSDNFDED